MTAIAINELSILIVEPSMTSTYFIKEQLKYLDIRKIEVCGSGREALEIIRSNPPDLIASAMYLPDMTATDLISIMRDDNQTENISFMLISTETSFARLDPIRQAGIIAILPKPFSNDDLRKALIGTTKMLNENINDSNETDLTGLNVLVVDDSAMSRKYICRVLNTLGIERITEADDGTTAVKILDRTIFDMVFTDYNMPKMDGDKLIHHIREQSMQRTIPILMITSEEDETRLAAIQQAGVSGICDKPFEPDTVLEMIHKIRAR